MNSRITTPLLTLLALGSLLLAACGANSTDTPLSVDPMNAAYTAAALTLTSVSPASATPAFQAAATVTPWPTISTTTNITLALATPTLHAANGAPISTCDNSAYVSDVTIPDGTEIAAGETFTKTWAIANTGTCTWTNGYTLAFYSGEDMDGSAAAITTSVAPNETVYISVDMVAPATTGSYVGYWRLSNAGGASFGATVYVMITVTGAYTATPTPSPTTETEATSTPTETPLPSETPTPQATVNSVTAAP